MKKLVLLLLGLSLAASARAGSITLSDFSDFTPDEFGFVGSWSSGTSLAGPTSFTIGDFGSGTPLNDGSFKVYLGGLFDFSSFSFVNLSGSPFGGNETSNFSFFFEDINGAGGLATFQPLAGVMSVNLTGLYSSIDATNITAWGFSTENQFGDSRFAYSFDQVSLSTEASSVPDSSVQGALWLTVLALIAFAHHRRRLLV